MSANPPLRKPRHADGRLMTEDEIRGLDGEALRYTVAEFIMEWGWVNVESGLGRRMYPWGGGKFEGDEMVPAYESDIAAAFTVDRPEWRWEISDFAEIDVDGPTAEIYAPECAEMFRMAAFSFKTNGKPTPADHAKARCIAALLLAAKIGE